jgi:inner membrane protein
VQGRWRHVLLGGLMMGLTYGLLYVLVSAEYASLLLGSLSLLAAIACLMYLTRKIDWYAYGLGDTGKSGSSRPPRGAARGPA